MATACVTQGEGSSSSWPASVIQFTAVLRTVLSFFRGIPSFLLGESLSICSADSRGQLGLSMAPGPAQGLLSGLQSSYNLFGGLHGVALQTCLSVREAGKKIYTVFAQRPGPSEEHNTPCSLSSEASSARSIWIWVSEYTSKDSMLKTLVQRHS